MDYNALARQYRRPNMFGNSPADIEKFKQMQAKLNPEQTMAEQIAATQKKQAEKNKRMGMDKPAVYKPKPKPKPKAKPKPKPKPKVKPLVKKPSKRKSRPKLPEDDLRNLLASQGEFGFIYDNPRPLPRARLSASTVRPRPPPPPIPYPRARLRASTVRPRPPPPPPPFVFL